MIEHELLLLGLLKEGPKHGYDIKIKIRRILSLFAGVELKSIYYPLRVLEKRGLVSRQVAKAGRRPERIVYDLTPKGEAHFQELLSKSLLSFKRPQFSLDLSLYFLEYLKPEVAHRRLRARLTILKKLAYDLERMSKDEVDKRLRSLTRMLEHNMEMVKAEYRFLTKLTKTI